MVLVIDNYDSFTYNLVQYLGELGAEVTVRRNDEASIDELKSLVGVDALLEIPADCDELEAGAEVLAWLVRPLRADG